MNKLLEYAVIRSQVVITREKNGIFEESATTRTAVMHIDKNSITYLEVSPFWFWNISIVHLWIWNSKSRCARIGQTTKNYMRFTKHNISHSIYGGPTHADAEIL